MGDSSRPDSLGTVFTGAFALFTGFVLGGVLTLATKVIVARLFTPEIYGSFSQGMAVLYTLVMVSMIGLNAGVSRFISFYREESWDKAISAVPSALMLALPAAVVVFGVLFVYADPIASLLFKDARMGMVLRVLAGAGPFMVLTSMVIAGFRGFQRSLQRVVLLDFVIPVSQISGIIGLYVLGMAFIGATIGYATGFVVASVCAMIWYYVSYPFKMPEQVIGELFVFSWPLMVSAVATQVFFWSPFILLGVMADSAGVGLLNSALPLAAATKMVLSSVAFLFLPVTTDLFSNNDFDGLRSVYSSATRWIVAVSMPLLVFLTFFASGSLGLVFGQAYTEASMILIVLVAGYAVNLVTGPAGEFLISVGRVRSEMTANVFKLYLFVALAFWLIPLYGLLGCAVAYAVAMAAGNITRFGFVVGYTGWFYDMSFLKPVVAGISAAVAGMYVPVPTLVQAVVVAVVYATALLLLRPLQEDDRELLMDFLGGYGLDTERAERFVDWISESRDER